MKGGEDLGRADREKQVQELKKLFSTMEMAVLADYRGMTVTQLTEFRTELRKVEGRFRVVKNTLSYRAAEGTPLEAVRDGFEGPVGIMYTTGDPVGPAKVIVEFLKKSQNLEPKIGMLGGRAISFEKVRKLAELPSRDTLLATILAAFNAPAGSFVRVLSGVPASFVRVLDAIRAGKQAA